MFPSQLSSQSPAGLWSGRKPIFTAVSSPLFGRQATIDELKDCNDTLVQELDSLKKYRRTEGDAEDKVTIDFVDGYQRSDEWVQEQFGTLLDKHEILKVLRLGEQKKLGLLEEAADLLLESYTLQAARQGIITQPLVEDNCCDYKRMRGQGELCTPKKFPEFLQTILEQIPEEKQEQFRRMTGLGDRKVGLFLGEEFVKETGLGYMRQADLLLGLIFSKFIQLHCNEENDKDVVEFAKSRIKLETDELLAYIPETSIHGRIIRKISQIIENRDDVPTGWVRRLTLYIAGRRLHMKLTHENFMQYSLRKQYGRQALNYSWIGSAYEPRKAVNKIPEVYYEVDALETARQRMFRHRLRQALRPARFFSTLETPQPAISPEEPV